MKNIIKLYRSYMIRPIIYKMLTRLGIGLVVSLLWNQFVNTQHYFEMSEFVFPIIGVFLLGMAWIGYLRLDGVGFHYKKIKDDDEKKKKHRTKEMIDYVEEDVVSFDELSKPERIACKFAANLFSGLIFIFLSVISSFF